MAKERIQVYVDAETKKRIELGASRRDTSVTKFCLEAIKTRLDEANILYKEEITVPVDRTKQQLTVLDEITRSREETLQKRDGELMEVDSVIRSLRDEQTERAAHLS